MESFKKAMVMVLIALCYALGVTAQNQSKNTTVIFTANQVSVDNQSKIEQSVKKMAGVSSAKVDVASKSIVVTFDEGKTTLDNVKTTLDGVSGKTTLKSINGKSTPDGAKGKTTLGGAKGKTTLKGVK